MPALPAHIVSLNLCADQYLLALADRRQIGALTVYAADPGMSAAAGAARGLPTTQGSAEALLTLAPDLLLVAPYQVAAKHALLPATRIVAVPEATDAAQIAANLSTVAAAVGHPERAGPLIARLRATLPPVDSGRGPIVAQYQRGGYLTGTGTLVDDLMRRAGLRNLAAVLHRPPLSRLSLEEIIAAKPDYLLIERRSGSGAPAIAARRCSTIRRSRGVSGGEAAVSRRCADAVRQSGVSAGGGEPASAGGEGRGSQRVSPD